MADTNSILAEYSFNQDISKFTKIRLTNYLNIITAMNYLVSNIIRSIIP